MKKIAIIPTLLTLGNAVCGLAAIAFASKIGGDTAADGDGYFAVSGGFIIAAMFFDLLDGYVARLSKTASDFGKELDSLCDAISFGVAPAFLLLRLGPGWTPLPRLHQVLAVVAALYMACAILRLARYNVETTIDPNSGKRFRGLPSPGAAGCVATLAILRGALVQRWPSLDPDVMRSGIAFFAPVGALAVALLMVSRIPYPHLTKQILRGRKPFNHLVQVLVAGCIIILLWDLALMLLFWVYALVIPLWYVLARSMKRGLSPASSPGLDDALPH